MSSTSSPLSINTAVGTSNVTELKLVLTKHKNVIFLKFLKAFSNDQCNSGARGSVVVKALCYKLEGREFDTR
jgi:hypothetical protein